MFATFALLLSVVVFQLILPSFGVWILERELVLFYLAFTVFVYQTLRRYYFTTGYGIGQPLAVLASFAVATAAVAGTEYAAEVSGSVRFAAFWGLGPVPSMALAAVAVAAFAGTFRFLRTRFLVGPEKELKERFDALQREISGIADFEELDALIRSGMERTFKTKTAGVQLWNS